MNSANYGAPMPKDLEFVRITGLTPGQNYTFQLAALTEHPTGRQDESNLFESQHCSSPPKLFESQIYSDSTPPYPSELGPELEVNLAGFCQPPISIFAELITGHSAVIRWKSGELQSVLF